MDITFVADCGSHTVKHACFSKTDKTLGFDSGVSEVPSTAYLDDALDVVLFGRQLAELLSDSCPVDSGLTLSLLLDVLLPQWKRELILKCCFEYLDAKRVFLGYAAATALFSVGKTTGIGMDVGYRGVRFVPVVNGIVQTSLCAEVQSVGARGADCVLNRHLPEAEEPILRALKSSACWVGEEPVALPSRLTLPDGNSLPFPISFAACREAGEALLFHQPHISAPVAVHYAYQKSLMDFPFLNEWVLFGGASAVKGVREVFRGALSHAVAPLQVTPHHLQAKVPMHAPLSGCVILSQLSSFKGMCVHAAEYEEEGPHRCIHLKAVDGR
ncbi:putative actin-like protein [Trypanosoma cruzi]|uniref:ALP6 n=2 Tax=Trypanosoma cruzi TaxID=5693 RepID=Q4CXD3_TRYCC|nr:actin-like protein, putative [Trypanosoma cruzi]ABF58717.1 ALP6 [Trypanosoma cruzi strain CL Brener]EAN84931.1 actin-like protein, putative [Trypanosoma cruzi]PWV18435.1 putative actin-like protein [Trypanosoma cruzi]RNC61678.1 putative actin-like protein [Trypanosoma cruzi]|eukprot:XP_806782.1 actin-like protein [Trypanosoma cruzi strain CL Brener]